MYLKTKEKIIDMENTNRSIYVIRDTSKKGELCYVSYRWDNWKEYYLIDYQNCMLFSYNSALSFIGDLIKENLNYQNLLIELSPYYKDCIQSENLEDVCDEFVMTHYFKETGYTHRKILNEYEQLNLMIKAIRLKKQNNKDKELKNEFNIYGCIWVEIKVSKDKSVFRLEPVVIMNDEGNFELI